MDALSGPDPEALLNSARRGHAEAQGQLLELYRSYIALLARLEVGRRLQAKVGVSDVVQETFLEAHRDFSQFRGTTEAEFMSWLRQILARNLANLVRRHYGTQRRDIRLERAVEDELLESSRALDHELAASQSSPSGRAARREQVVLLTEALDRLPEHYREVIIMRHFEGLPFHEVAKRMQRSVDSVKKLWLRALPRLRNLLGALP